MPKESFVLYKSFYEPVKTLSDKQLGRLFRALFNYQIEGSTQVDADLQMAFAFFKNQMDLDEKNSKKGKYHWNWKGGVSDKNHVIRTSKEMNEWRKGVFIRDNYTCQSCGKVGGKLNAHHIKPFSLFPKLRFDINNGLTLCKKCHIEHHKIEREWIK